MNFLAAFAGKQKPIHLQIYAISGIKDKAKTWLCGFGFVWGLILARAQSFRISRVVRVISFSTTSTLKVCPL